jgi:hypothetical protein
MTPEEKIRTEERFVKELWPLNKAGEHKYALSELIHAIDDDMLVGGGVVTFDIILAKYKEHLQYYKATNSDRDARYQTKPDEISKFIVKKRYNEDFIPHSNSSIDRYLYGD